MGTVEVETAESVNHLEAMAQWAHLGRARAPFHLYVPAGSVDIARRLAAENQVNVAEIWSYHTIGDQTRFTLVHRRLSGQAACGGQTADRRTASGRLKPLRVQRPSRWRRSVQHLLRDARPRRARRARRPPHESPRARRRGNKPCRILRFSRDKRGYETTSLVHSEWRRAPLALPHPLLVPDTAWREGRSRCVRRGGDPPDRREQSRRRVRLDSYSQGSDSSRSKACRTFPGIQIARTRSAPAGQTVTAQHAARKTRSVDAPERDHEPTATPEPAPVAGGPRTRPLKL